jgi:hypothetical protein
VHNIQDLVYGLSNNDDKKAYECLKQLKSESSQSDAVYPFFDIFADMLDDENSYVRTRGIVLIAVNAQWDSDYKIDEIIDKYLKHITDDKPITARQCIKVLPVIAKYKPDLRQDILNALHRANPTRYKESMQSLVVKDIQKCLNDIEKL